MTADSPKPVIILGAAPPLPAFAVPRSPDWPEARRDHLRIEPACLITGIDDPKRLNVHHGLPFHLFPERELDQSNLYTLAESPINVHFLFGHGGRSWLDYNPAIRSQLKLLRKVYRDLAKSIVRGRAQALALPPY